MNSYFALRILSKALSEELKDAVLLDAYRQNKQSVIFAFEKKDRAVFYIETFFSAEECLFHFPEEQSKSRKAVNLMKEAHGLRVISIEQAENERTFVIHLQQGFSIVFKWFGRQSNILLWNKGEVVWILRDKLKNDALYNRALLHKSRQWSEEEFEAKGEDLNAFIPQLGKETIQKWIAYSHWNEVQNSKDRWLKVQALLTYLREPTFYVLQKDHRAYLSLLFFKEEPDVVVLSEEHDPLLAANLYFQAYFRYNRVEILKEKLVHFFTQKETGLSKQIHQLSQKVIEFDQMIPPQQMADLIMANLHVFQNSRKAEVLNFYTNEPLEITIKQGLSATDYASQLYKKSRNRQSEKANMLARVEQMRTMRNELEEASKQVETADVRALIDLKEKYLPPPGVPKQPKDAPPVFKEYECQGYKILVGRNAKNNDELTLHYAHKEDLWLHAKDVSGSHVVVKHKANNPFPKPVIERAARLAAFYSKRKKESLCPVMYTLKKYVRKVKGSPAGMVRVEKESVILVEPLEA